MFTMPEKYWEIRKIAEEIEDLVNILDRYKAQKEDLEKNPPISPEEQFRPQIAELEKRGNAFLITVSIIFALYGLPMGIAAVLIPVYPLLINPIGILILVIIAAVRKFNFMRQAFKLENEMYLQRERFPKVKNQYLKELGELDDAMIPVEREINELQDKLDEMVIYCGLSDDVADMEMTPENIALLEQKTVELILYYNYSSDVQAARDDHWLFKNCNMEGNTIFQQKLKASGSWVLEVCAWYGTFMYWYILREVYENVGGTENLLPNFDIYLTKKGVRSCRTEEERFFLKEVRRSIGRW